MTTSIYAFKNSLRWISGAALAQITSAAFLPGCDGSDDRETAIGVVQVTTYGEEFIEEGISADEMGDGWAVEFERFLVTISGVEVGGEVLAEPTTIDIAQPSDGAGHKVGELVVAGGDHKLAGFTIERVEVDGTATLDDVEKTFRWVFEAPVTYSECETTTSVADDGEATFQITVHADHLFYDSLVASEPRLLFSPLAAADANSDGEITKEELAAADIGTYDPGNEDADDLWSFLSALVATLGHVDGEGHCHAHPGGE